MSPLKVLIVEDEPSFAIELSMLIEEIGYLVLSVIDNSEEALKLIKAEKPDIILMDIDIKGPKNGLEVADAITHLKIPILFITSFKREEYYQKAKAISAVGYLVKPVQKLTLRSSIELSLRNLGKQLSVESDLSENENFVLKDCFFIKKNNLLKKVQITDIQHINASRNYSIIQTKEEKFVLKTSLSKLEEQLPQNLFLRVHKSYVINLQKIKDISLTEGIILENKEIIPIGRTHKQLLLERLNLLE